MWQQPVPGYDPSRYETLRVEASAADGVKVAISLARKKGVTGPAPLLLRAYGSYGSNSDPFFASSGVSLLNRGVVLVKAHIRGGGRWARPGTTTVA